MLTKTKSPELHRLIDHEDRATNPQPIRLAADVLADVEAGVFPPRVGWQCARGLETDSRRTYTGTKLETADTAKGSLRVPRQSSTLLPP